MEVGREEGEDLNKIQDAEFVNLKYLSGCTIESAINGFTRSVVRMSDRSF